MLAAVLGHPINHSLSPVLHNAAYAALGLIDWHYQAIDCIEDGLAELLAERTDWAGFSCTMPLKRVALQLAEQADPLASVVGAANTLLPRPGGGWRAAMTDVVGITAALNEAGTAAALGGRRVTLLGAGGTAQAALVAAAELGAAQCTALVRDHRRTDELLATAERLGIRVRIADLDPAAPELDAELIVSTLPAHAADPLAARAWRSDQTVLDASYDPWPSALAAAARRAGATVVSGAAMLLHQAAEQVRLMTGATPPLEAMRAALHAAVPNSGI